MRQSGQRIGRVLLLAIGLVGAGAGAGAAMAAGGPTPAESIKARIANFREIGAAFKAINDGLRGDEPQTILIQQSARQIRNFSNQVPGWFPAGTGPEAGVKTSAKPAIWQQPAKFKAAAAAFQAEAAKFQAVAAGGDAEAMRAAARSLGGTCKGCHDSFRVPGN